MSNDTTFNIKEIMSNFDIMGDFSESSPYGSGHINDTYVVVYNYNEVSKRYILQRINNFVFKDPEMVMENVSRICETLQNQFKSQGVGDVSRRALTTFKSISGLPYYKDTNDNVWRLFLFIEGGIGYEIIENEEQAYQTASAFGEFQKLLNHLPGDRLHETIPGFHDTVKRFNRFKDVINEDTLGLSKNAKEEIKFYLSYENEVGRLLELHKQGLIPERVTHNDTKLSNVLLDSETNEALCVIDLDTTMPGLVLYDFGDMVRTSTTNASEDEKDLTLIDFQPEMFRALVRGYLSTASEFLTLTEVKNLVFGGILMTYEAGLRFLTDYIEGNVYFKATYSDHNLIRCRTQMTLVKLIESESEELEIFVMNEYESWKNNKVNR